MDFFKIYRLSCATSDDRFTSFLLERNSNLEYYVHYYFLFRYISFKNDKKTAEMCN